jgi:hypothetical protein
MWTGGMQAENQGMQKSSLLKVSEFMSVPVVEVTINIGGSPCSHDSHLRRLAGEKKRREKRRRS